jgi:hypothetical protein
LFLTHFLFHSAALLMPVTGLTGSVSTSDAGWRWFLPLACAFSLIAWAVGRMTNFNFAMNGFLLDFVHYRQRASDGANH